MTIGHVTSCKTMYADSGSVPKLNSEAMEADLFPLPEIRQ